MPKARIVPQGLRSGLNDILVPPGACIVAENVVFGADGTVLPRWGWQEYSSGTRPTSTGTPESLAPFDGVIVSTLPTYAGFRVGAAQTAVPLDDPYSNSGYEWVPLGAMAQCRGRLYTCVAAGGNLMSIGDSTDTAAVPGGLTAPQIRYSTYGDGTIPSLYSYGIVVCLKRTYDGGVVVRSAPSAPVFPPVYLSSRSDKYAVLLPSEAKAGDVLEFYRTAYTLQTSENGGAEPIEPTAAPGADYFLVREVRLTTSDLASWELGTYTITGVEPLGAALYTNVSVEGIELSNYKAPSGLSLASYKGSLFVGGSIYEDRVTINLRNVAGLVPDNWSGAGAYTTVWTLNGESNACAFDMNQDNVPEGIGVWQMDTCVCTNGSADITVTDGTPIRIGQLVTGRGTTGSPTGWTAATPLYVAGVSGTTVTLSATNTGGVDVSMDFHDVIEVRDLPMVAHTSRVLSAASTNGLSYFDVWAVEQTAAFWTNETEQVARTPLILYKTAQNIAYLYAYEKAYAGLSGYAYTPGLPFGDVSSAGTVTFLDSTYNSDQTSDWYVQVNGYNPPGSTTNPYTDDYVGFPNLSNDQVGGAYYKDQQETSRRVVSWSKQDQPEHFPPLYQTTLGSDFIAFASTEDVLYIFTKREIYALSGDGPSSGWTLEQITPADDSGVYLLDHKAVYAYNDTVYALTNLGLVSLRGGSIEKIDQAIPQDIRRFVQSSTRSSYTICMGVNPTYETLVISFTLGTTSTTTYAYSLTTGLWTTLTSPMDRGTNVSTPWSPFAYTILDSRLYYLGKTAAVSGSASTANDIAVFASRQWTTSSTQEDMLHNFDMSFSDTTVTVTGSSSPYTLSGVDVGIRTEPGDILVAPNGTYCFVTDEVNGIATVIASSTPNNGTYTRYEGYTCRLKFFPWVMEQHGEYKLWRTLSLAFNQRLGLSTSQKQRYVKVSYEGHNGAAYTGSFVNLASLPVATFYVPKEVARGISLGPDISWYPWEASGLSGLEVSYVITEKGKVGWRRS